MPSHYTVDLAVSYDMGDQPENEYLRNISLQLVVKQCHQQAAAIRLQGFDIRKRRLSILGLGGQPDSKADIVDDHQDLVGKLKAEF